MFFDEVVQVKLLFREAYILNIKWDNLFPSEFVVKYNNFIEELQRLFVSVQRYLLIKQYNITELHGFYDASTRAYSTAIYVRSLKNDNIITNLLTAKSKILKLELMCCLLLLLA